MTSTHTKRPRRKHRDGTTTRSWSAQSARRVLALALCLLFSVAPAAVAVAAPPNLVFILTDDQRFDSMGCAGNTAIQTPNLDRLAANGVRFRNHFATTAICAVSRASIFSGQYERRHGIGNFSTPFSADQWQATYPMRLRAAGYRTGFIGKFGVGNAKQIAAREGDFDYWRGLPGQAGEWFIDPQDATKTHATARFGDQALEFLDGSTNGQPFSLSISFNAPHARDGKPREFRPDLRDESLYANDTLPVPVTATEEYFNRLPEFVRKSEGRRRWEKRFANPEMFQSTMRDYYRLVTGIDREVGRIMAKLEERGLATNTVIVFTSDNGWFAGERGMADKWLMYEASIRLPMIVLDPRIPSAARGRTVDALTLNIDCAPTLLDLAGLPIPEQMQGRSLRPFLTGERPADWRTDFFYEHHFGPAIIPPSEGIRTERWTYLRWMPPNPESEELYDVRADPFEQRDLAADPAFAETLKTLREQWRRTGPALK
jgi:arylsulfatase A-like enzyme